MKQKRIAVVQLARLGDVLQSFPAIRGLREKNPDATISLIVRRSFLDAAKLCVDVNELIVLDARDIAEKKSLDALKTFVANCGRFDELYNLSFSETSSYLCSLIPATHKVGYVRDVSETSSDLIVTDRWSQYFLSTVQGSTLNTIHVTDLFARVCGVGVDVWPMAHYQVALSPEYVGIQIGASRLSKTLSFDMWVETLKAIEIECVQQGSTQQFLLFGSQAEQALIDSIVTTAGVSTERFSNVAGSTSFDRMEDLVARCKLVFTPDTAVVHLASLINVPVLLMSVGGARPQETGPYGNGHYVLQIHDSATRATLPKELSTVIIYGEGRFKDIRTLAISRTKLIKTSDGSLRQILEAVNYNAEEVRDFFEKSYYLLAEFRCAGRNEDISPPTLKDAKQTHSADEFAKHFRALTAIDRLAEYGLFYCGRILDAIQANKPIKDMKVWFDKLNELEKILINTADQMELIKPLVAQNKVVREVSPVASGSLSQMVEVTETSYRILKENIQIFNQLLSSMLEQMKNQTTQVTSDHDQKEAHIATKGAH